MLKYRSQKEQMMNFVKKHENYFCSVDRETYQAFAELLHSKRLLKKVIPESKGEETVNMCKALEELYEDGVEDGIKTGIKTGENYFATLTEKLLKDSRIDDLGKATSDLKFRNVLYKEYHINREMDLK